MEVYAYRFICGRKRISWGIGGEKPYEQAKEPYPYNRKAGVPLRLF